MSIEIIFLGTSAGIPTKTRNLSAIAIRMQDSKDWYLVDCGEGTQQQILRTHLSLNTLQAIFITHVHGDHCYGLPGLIASAAMTGRKLPLQIFAPAELQLWFESVRVHTQLQLNYALSFTAVEDLQTSAALQDFNVDTVKLSHRVPSYAYAFRERAISRALDTAKMLAAGIPPGPAWGELQKGTGALLADGRVLRSEDFLLPSRKPGKVIVCGDNDQPQLLSECCRDSGVLIHEATYSAAIAEKIGGAAQHSTAAMVARFAQQAQLKNLILTHFSARYQDDISRSPSIQDLEDEARSIYTGNLFMARDFDSFVLNHESELSRKSPHS